MPASAAADNVLPVASDAAELMAVVELSASAALCGVVAGMLSGGLAARLPSRTCIMAPLVDTLA